MTEQSRWSPVKDMMRDAASVQLSAQATAQWRERPREVLAELNLTKFTAKMIGLDARVLDIGCGEGLGTWLLAVECSSALGVDRDDNAIATATSNWRDERIAFEAIDKLSQRNEQFEGVFVRDARSWAEGDDCADVERVVETLGGYLQPRGTLVLGIKITDEQYDCVPEHWRSALNMVFHHVMVFSMLGESMMVGQRRGTERLIFLACGKHNASEASDG